MQKEAAQFPFSRPPQNFHEWDQRHSRDCLKDEVLAGLGRTPKTLPSKLFYDAEGSVLFEAICRLDEYYLTRTETSILEEVAVEIAEWVGEGAQLIEYGSGSSRKTRILLEALQPAAYVPVEIDREVLLHACEVLSLVYPDLQLFPICADYTQSIRLPIQPGRIPARRLIFFPGSTIGNFLPAEALSFLQGAHQLAGEDGVMLVGVDLKKDAETLNAAYDDAQGVTAAFNLNLLAHLNRELGANFDLDTFTHRAFYNEALGRVEMHLASLKPQDVMIQGHHFHFHDGETIHTENSYKYSVEQFQQLAMEAGFETIRYWTDPDKQFSVHCLAGQAFDKESAHSIGPLLK